MRRHAVSLYLDTSVLGGYFDAEFQADTRVLWQLRKAGRFRFVSSQVVHNETAGAPEPVQELLRSSIAEDDMLTSTAETEELAEAYLARKVVPRKCSDDALHVALCSIAGLDYLVSWNFKHLANGRREAGFNAVNILQGYPPMRIVTPTFLIHDHEEKDL